MNAWRYPKGIDGIALALRWLVLQFYGDFPGRY